MGFAGFWIKGRENPVGFGPAIFDMRYYTGQGHLFAGKKSFNERHYIRPKSIREPLQVTIRFIPINFSESSYFDIVLRAPATAPGTLTDPTGCHWADACQAMSI
jgi:hypothetical protein